ncbi:unnamed protein product (macronuclear) [Paramecium tetraurelia]|uniref:Uncharacterized protein n=1 Tax=Paramecium tetraurelia TaxID=5888 RepID=A0D7B6_PARTE|nr:uncharacterized protein GSPATT00001975001 [Paramecium tetraurelia]CAK78933.1 unnamed protein product [Paramecium tetraurelia]|eukprot:XP_001446330.1 hypothetical protein (macronuclear) [Paramecium tetraurelia strain d4-2]
MIHGPNSQFSGAYTIGKRYESAIYQTNPNPGPNHYSINPIDKPIGFKFSKSNRKPLYQPSIAPDPGAYDLKFQTISQTSPSAVFTTAKDHQERVFEIGPGSYNWTDQKKAPAFTFQSKFDSIGNQILQNPGPGTYEIKHYHTHQPQNKGLSTSQRANHLTSSTPGPGSYDVEIPKYSTNIKFPKSQRSLEQSEFGPGPGAFDLSIPKQQGITFGVKGNQQTEKQSVPGPGSYKLKSFVGYDERDLKQNKVKGAKIGTSKRSSQNFLKLGPSPLDYDVSKYKYPTRHASFGSAVRSSIVPNEKTPGPGQYMVDSKLRRNGPVIPKASKDFNSLDNNPGPGKYNPNISMSTNKGPSYHIAGKYEKPQEDSLVGPGRYNIQRNINDGPKYTFPTLEKSMDNKSLDINQQNPQVYLIRSHCYEIQQTIGYIPPYNLQN